MTSRERLIAASRGGIVDRLPWFCWDCPEPLALAGGACPDIVVADSPDQAADILAGMDERGSAVLVSVLNPHGLALQEGQNLNEKAEYDPKSVSQSVEAYAERVAAQIEAALASGADGVLYRIVGADPAHSTPMQYGGFHLETDRALLQSISEAVFNVALADGKNPYLDFLTDLPVHALAWGPEATALSGYEVQRMRSGAVAYGLWSGWENIANSQPAGTILAGPFDPKLDYCAVARTLEENVTEVVQ